MRHCRREHDRAGRHNNWKFQNIGKKKDWIFKNEQNLVFNQNGTNPLWPLTLFHKLQQKTLGEIQEATTWRLCKVNNSCYPWWKLETVASLGGGRGTLGVCLDFVFGGVFFGLLTPDVDPQTDWIKELHSRHGQQKFWNKFIILARGIRKWVLVSQRVWGKVLKYLFALLALP